MKLRNKTHIAICFYILKAAKSVSGFMKSCRTGDGSSFLFFFDIKIGIFFEAIYYNVLLNE